MQRINPYDVLGIEKTASESEIHKAYYKLARMYHPDRLAGKTSEAIKEAETHFKLILAAYEMLAKQDLNLQLDNADDANLLQYGPDQITSTNAMLNLQDEDKFDRIKFTERAEIFFTDDKEFFFFKKNLNKDTIDKPLGNQSLKIYNTKHLDCLTEEQIREKFTIAKNRYHEIDTKVSGNAFLWIAEKKDCAPIYIFSTCHDIVDIKGSLEDRFGDVVDNIVDKVDIVFTEIELCEISSYLFDMLTILKNEKIKKEKYTSMDEFIKSKAFKQNKELRALEDKRVRKMAIFDGVSPLIAKIMEEDIKAYKESLLSHEHSKIHTENYFNNIVFGKLELYGDKDITDEYVVNFRESLNYTIDNENDLNMAKNCLKQYLNASDGIVINRNLFWMEDSILPVSSIEKKISMIADGGRHNSGKFGLPNLLANKGYTLTPLMEKAPMSKKAIVRDLAFSRDVSLFKPIKLCAKDMNEIQANKKINFHSNGLTF